MPTDRGLVIIGFEIIAWSCVKRNEKRETVASTADSWLPVHATGMLPACSRTCSGAATCNVREHRASPNTADHKRQTSGNHNHNRNRKPHADRMQHGGRGGGIALTTGFSGFNRALARPSRCFAVVMLSNNFWASLLSSPTNFL